MGRIRAVLSIREFFGSATSCAERSWVLFFFFAYDVTWLSRFYYGWKLGMGR
jgi:hypothetical protein